MDSSMQEAMETEAPGLEATNADPCQAARQPTERLCERIVGW